MAHFNLNWCDFLHFLQPWAVNLNHTLQRLMSDWDSWWHRQARQVPAKEIHFSLDTSALSYRKMSSKKSMIPSCQGYGRRVADARQFIRKRETFSPRRSITSSRKWWSEGDMRNAANQDEWIPSLKMETSIDPQLRGNSIELSPDPKPANEHERKVSVILATNPLRLSASSKLLLA